MKCLKCTSGNLEKVTGTEPYNQDYLQCDNCDSTFNIDELEIMENNKSTEIDK
jgi:hypothetical protein